MENVDLIWEQNEVEVEEEEEVGGLSKAIKEVTNGEIETNGHANSTSKITNGTEKSDLDDEQERSEEKELSDSSNGVEVDEGTEPKEVSVQRIVVSNNGIEEGTENSDLGDEPERSEEKDELSDSNNGVEVDEGTEPKEELVQQIVLSKNGVEVEEETEPNEELVQQIIDSTDGVEEETEQIEESVKQIVASNGAEKGTEVKEEPKHHHVEGVTEPKEVSVQQIVASVNGVEEGTEPKEVSVQQLVASDNGVEERIEPKEELFQKLAASNNGVKEGTEAKEESNQHLVSSTNRVEVEKGTEAEEGPFRSGHFVYYDKGEDSNFISTHFIKEKIDKIPGDGIVQESATLDVHLNGYLKNDNLSSSSTQLSKNLSEDYSIVRKSTAIDEIESADADLINDSDTDVKDFDVENVIQKQNTHDLYCPNCKSCITKRVILRKRKRKIRVSGDDVKRNKLEVVVDSKVDASHSQAAADQVPDGADISTPLLAVDDYQTNREPEIFRCLSCFSFFIPTGNGFRLFRFFGEKGNKENVKVEPTPTTNKNWFSSIFSSGSGVGANAVKNDSGVPMPSDNFKDQSTKPLLIKEPDSSAYSSSEITQEAGGKILGSNNQDANMKGKMVINTVGKSEDATKSQEGGSVFDIFDAGTYNQPGTSISSKEGQGNDRSDQLLSTTGRTQVSDGNLVQESLSESNDRKDELFGTGGRIQVSNGNFVEESLPASNHRKDELFGTGGRIQVSNGNLVPESLPASNDGKDELLRTGGKIQVSNGNLVEDSVPASQQNELWLHITSTKDESLTIEKSETDLKSDVAILNKDPGFTFNGLDGNGKPKLLTDIPQEDEQHIETKLPSECLQENNDNKFQLSSKDGAHHYEVSQHTITKTNIEIHSKQPLKVDQGSLMSSVKGALSIQDKPDNITNISVEPAANSIAGNDTIITVEPGHETTETASANVDTETHSVEGQGTDAAEAYKIEIIKSIVFGGLAESVTSLSIVASATGGDTSTLNILVLAMANLIGGLFIIFHNIWDLKRDRFEQASNQIMERYVDRYREQLGRRENFTVHAIFVVLSYLIFGLVPPVIYGFSFRKSDDKELKIVAVAAASLVCILMLATGKAYAQKPPKPSKLYQLILF